MVAYTKPQHRKEEESEQLRGEGDKAKFIDRARVSYLSVQILWKGFVSEFYNNTET